MALDPERSNETVQEVKNLRSIIALQRQLMTSKQVGTLLHVAHPEQMDELRRDVYPLFANNMYRNVIEETRQHPLDTAFYFNPRLLLKQLGKTLIEYLPVPRRRH